MRALLSAEKVSDTGNSPSGERRSMPLSFGKTERVPHAESLIAINGQQMAAVRRKAERRPIAAPIGADRVSSEHAAGPIISTRHNVPNANGSIVTRREQRSPV